MPLAFEAGAGSSSGSEVLPLWRISFTTVPFGSQFEPVKAILVVSALLAVGVLVGVADAVPVGEGVTVGVADTVVVAVALGLLLVPFGSVSTRLGAPAFFCFGAARTV